MNVKQRLWPVIMLLSIVMLSSGCSPATRGASQTAMEFFDALYVEADLDRVLELSGPQLRDILSHYGDVALIQEHLLALQFDDPTQISTVHRRALLLEEHRNMVDVTIFLSGIVKGYQYSDERKVRMRRKGDTWYVEKFLI